MKIKNISVLALGVLMVAMSGCASTASKTAATSTPASASDLAPIAEGPNHNAWGSNFPASY
jgi:uncharacterized protein YceK